MNASASNSGTSCTMSSSTMIISADTAEPSPLDSVPTSAVNGSATSPLNSDQNPPHSSASLSPPPELELPVSWPQDGKLSLDWIYNLMACFDWSSKNLSPSEFPCVFPVHVFDSLILVASKMLHKEPNCVSVDPFQPNSDSRDRAASAVVVVGDVHGQLHDLLFLLRDAGYPSQNRIFVFNGDYVDRGAWGLETFLLLLAWKVFMPHNVYLLRGNHESKYCTSVYGFEKEVMAKYSDKAHGGLFRSVSVTPSKRLKGKRNRKNYSIPDNKTLSLGSLEELSKARRSVLDPPWEGSNLIPGDVLWSDPSQTPGLSPNKERGIGLLWGPDCTEEFLKKYQLKFIIRSHEGPDAREKRDGFDGMDEGYTIDHIVDSGKMITLFSAPDYPQFQATDDRYNNKGAYVVLEPPHFDNPVFHCFEAVIPRPKVNAYYDYEEVINSDEELDLASMVTA
ncbi:serine/threonine-protein phosphatase 7 isoform X4 [Prosopis cineraria]|uniref:serine/threonine-protein phosphatase 7 isoform X4 n=1 Tax=Prosopis cineraria TaxID=364024 RepID=UPI002410619A|nr:serine/threonine-protein phosphatase 7 isoform X4 [Prosopis cineraria]